MSDIVFKIHRGTAKGGGTLCRTCTNAHVVRGVNNEEFIRCTHGEAIGIRFEVAECNRYYSAALPTLYEMEEIAWRLVTKTGGRSFGFVDAKEFKKRSPFDNMPDIP